MIGMGRSLCIFAIAVILITLPVLSEAIVDVARNATPSTGEIRSYIVSPEEYRSAIRTISSLVARAVEREKTAIERGSKPDKNIKDTAKEFLSVLPFNELGRGSAWVLDREHGLVITNHHVVGSGVHFVVRFANGVTAKLKLVASDLLTDVALLYVVEKDGELPPALKFDTACETLEGEEVVSIGYPTASLEIPSVAAPSWTLSYGRIISRERTSVFLDVSKIDNQIIPGFSGGPTLSKSCGVIGMNVMRNPSRIIPISVVEKTVRELLLYGKVRRGFLGMGIGSIYDLSEGGWFISEGLDPRYFPDKGLLVRNIMNNSPAKRAGVKEKDVIMAIDGRDVAYVSDLMDYISNLLPGSTVSLRIWRNGEVQTLTVVIADRSEFSDN
jgi:serine protease Do